MSFLEYVLNCEERFSFFIFWSRLSDIWINCNQISKGLLYIHCHDPNALVIGKETDLTWTQEHKSKVNNFSGTVSPRGIFCMVIIFYCDVLFGKNIQGWSHRHLAIINRVIYDSMFLTSRVHSWDHSNSEMSYEYRLDSLRCWSNGCLEFKTGLDVSHRNVMLACCMHNPEPN
jgi:hypothetical protein